MKATNSALLFLSSLFAALQLSPAITVAGLLPVHPLCIYTLVEQREQKSDKVIDLEACQKTFKHYPVTAEGHWKAEYQQLQATTAGNLPVYVSYQAAGVMLDDQMLVNYTVNYGGSGTFTSALLIKGFPTSETAQKNRELKITRIFPGGDRCHGGIQKLFVSSPDTFLVTRGMTAAELIRYDHDNSEAASKLPDCAICCVGSITESTHLHGRTTFVNVRFASLQGLSSTAGTACLNRFLSRTAGIEGDVLLNRQQVSELQGKFVKECSDVQSF